ncbi:MAG TPA: GAF domain-containing sensor histidine kinase [Thermomicrobiales bacterium]|nr:GAF domain-containing sensor histidine kinase [Thermomicrobiales bacterium]
MATELSGALLARIRDPERLAAVRRLEPPATSVEEPFARQARLAARLLAAPGVLISLIDGGRQVLAGGLGLPDGWGVGREAALGFGLCPYVVAGGAPLPVADAREHPAYRDLPAVAEFDIAGYLGVPLETDDGQVVGSFCVFDHRPREWSVDDVAAAEDLAATVATALDLRAAAARARRQAETAEAAIRARDEFLAGVSHDLKTPLSTIKGYAQLLRMRASREVTPETLPGIVDGAAKIEATANKMTALINELLDVARLEAGEPLRLECAPTDLVALAAEAIAMHRANSEGRRIDLVAPEAELVGDWDQVRLERVLDNLLSNALKYSREGAVTVRAARDGDRAVLAVRDTGVGIPADDLPRIFERFHRGGNVEGRIAGTGLGLAGVRHIVEQHGGTIDVASREGAGTTVTVRLPLAGSEG